MDEIDRQLLEAVTKGELEKAKHLTENEHASVHGRDEQNRTFIHIAVENGDAKMVQLLIENDILTEEMFNDVNLLDLACDKKNGEIGRLLLKDYSAAENLHRMVAQKKYETLTFFLTILEDVDEVNDNDTDLKPEHLFFDEDDQFEGQSALQFAVSLGDEKAAEILLKAGADPDFTQEDGSDRRVLQTAVLGLRPTLIKLLLEHGAAIDGEDSYGVTALCHLTGIIRYKTEEEIPENYKQSYRVLMDHEPYFGFGYNGESIFISDMSEGVLSFFIKEQFDKDGGIKVKKETTHTLLCWAVLLRRPDLVTYLLEKGVDINEKDGSGFLALLYSIEKNDLDLTVLLLANGADKNSGTTHSSPVDAARKMVDLYKNGPYNEKAKARSREILALFSSPADAEVSKE